MASSALIEGGWPRGHHCEFDVGIKGNRIPGQPGDVYRLCRTTVTAFKDIFVVFAVLDVGHSLYRISDTSRQEGSDGTTIDRTPGPDWVVQITGTSTGMTTHIPSHRNAWYTPTCNRNPLSMRWSVGD